MLQPGRSFSSTAYRYGFNGQERTDEISGAGNHNTALFWEYDTRLGRRWNVDPILQPWESPFSCFHNNPISLNDPEGDNPKNTDKHVSKSEERNNRHYTNLFDKTLKHMQKDGQQTTFPNGRVDKPSVQAEMSRLYPKQTNKILTQAVKSQATDWKRGSSVVTGTSQTRTSPLVTNSAPQNGSGTSSSTYNLPGNTSSIQVTGDNFAVPDRLNVTQVNTSNSSNGNNKLFDMDVYSYGQYDTGNIPTVQNGGNQIQINIISSDGLNSNWTYTVNTTQAQVFSTPRPVAFPIIQYEPK